MRLALPCSSVSVLIGLLLLVMAACAEFPELDGTLSAEQLRAPPPALVPLSPLLAQAAMAPSGGPTAAQTLDPRIAALRARASRLRGPVISPQDRARMLRGPR